MLRFMLILETPAEECHAKNRVDPVGISIIKYLDITNISFRFSASAYAVYTVNARFYVYPPKKKSDILYLVTDNPRTIVYNYFYTS